MAVWTKHGVSLHSGCSSILVWWDEVNIKKYCYFLIESARVNVRASVTFSILLITEWAYRSFTLKSKHTYGGWPQNSGSDRPNMAFSYQLEK